MAIYSAPSDAPNGISLEGQSMSLVFKKTDPTAGTVCWSIPAPLDGCTAETRSYDGVVIVGSTSPITVENNPVNGTKYVGDPTMDYAVHMGSKINGALVVGAFYEDVTTSCILVTGLDPNKVYYFSAFAVDNVLNYDQAGKKSYSESITGELAKATGASQTIKFTPGVNGSDGTGLDPTKSYTFKIEVDKKNYDITINGINALTYTDLINELNKKFASLSNPYYGAVPPNTNQLYYDPVNKKLYKWDGYKYVEVPVVVSSDDPSTQPIGAYWYKPDTDELFKYNGTIWVLVSETDIIKYSHDPANPVCDDIWYDGTVGQVWNGYTWCDKPTYAIGSDPALAPILSCSDYWFDLTTGTVKQWQTTDLTNCDNDEGTTITGYWKERDVLFSAYDPNTPVEGDYWYDDDDNKLYVRDNANTWVEVNLITTASGEPTAFILTDYYHDVALDKFYKRNIDNTAWEEVEPTKHTIDPTIRNDCDLWLNSDTNMLYVWDDNAGVWVLVTNFTISENDPSEPPTIEKCAIWYDTLTGKLYQYDGTKWFEKEFINYATDPRTLPDGVVWYDTTNDQWNERDTNAWVPFNPIETLTDPTMPVLGSMWFDPDDNTLYQWNGMAWVPVMYTTTPYTPAIGDQWFNTTNNTLYAWDGNTWVPTAGIATAVLDDQGNIVLYSNTVGCNSTIHLILPYNMWVDLQPTPRVLDTVPGTDPIRKEPMTSVLGIGTDGDQSFRKELAEHIKLFLGYPVVQVELTPAHIDLVINNAIEELRMRSGFAYKRAFYFLRGRNGKQVYVLNDSCGTTDKIVSILKISRQRGAYYGSSDNTIFSQQFIQDLYTVNQGYDLVTFEAAAQYTELLERMFAADIRYLWDERSRKLQLLQQMRYNELLMLDCVIERTEQDIMSDRYIKNWVQDMAVADAKIILGGAIRNKFTSGVPGPNGATTLNGADLLAEGKEEKAELMLELDNMIANNPEEWVSQIILG